jgi:hypothetical protein
MTDVRAVEIRAGQAVTIRATFRIHEHRLRRVGLAVPSGVLVSATPRRHTQARLDVDGASSGSQSSSNGFPVSHRTTISTPAKPDSPLQGVRAADPNGIDRTVSSSWC